MLLPGLVRDGHLLANVLYADHEPIAFSLCCHFGNWVGQMKTSYDARHSDLSPGLMTVDATIQRSIELGAGTYDFLGGPDAYKLAWSKTVRGHANYTIYRKRSPRGERSISRPSSPARLHIQCEEHCCPSSWRQR